MRYHRQELVIGKNGQKKLNKSTVAIVGIGAIGSVSAELLTRAGIGTLLLIDRDIVELTNLQRQFLYTEDDVDQPKAYAAYNHLCQINRESTLLPRSIDLTWKTINCLEDADLILDGTDNLSTRFLMNEYCKKRNIPWIYAGAIRHYATLQVITRETPCFRCVFKEAVGLDTCDTAGILNTTSALIASLQVTEALKILLDKQPLKGLLSYHLWNQRLSHILIKKNMSCPVCAGTYEFLEGTKEPQVQQFCGGTHYQFCIDPESTARMRNLWKHYHLKKRPYGFTLHTSQESITIFQDGRVLIKARNVTHAKSIFSKYIGL